MKRDLERLITEALAALQREGVLSIDTLPTVQIERTRDARHGDFACNVAMVLATTSRIKPRELAERICAAIPAATFDIVEKVEVADPGFINFFLKFDLFHSAPAEILKKKEKYGRSNGGQGKRVIVEFVSANPTGPLHVGHGRGAAYGDAVANLLEAIGFNVHREYYINDTGRQMDILGLSVWLRYLERCGELIEFPINAYRGDYIKDIAIALHKKEGTSLCRSADVVMQGVPPEIDAEAQLDRLIEQAEALIGKEDFRKVTDLAIQAMLEDIREDLAQFGVEFDEWFSERSLVGSQAVEKVIDRLKKGRHTYSEGGAFWFKASGFRDEKDRVLVRENGQPTYFALDAAYHLDKFNRHFDRMIDIWGADHHGYVPRLKAVIEAMGEDREKLDVRLVQFVSLYRGQEKVQMSTRSGEFVTLRELREEIGRDAARFFYILRKSEQHLDFDLQLAKSQSSDNPVYYIQYAHARICSVMRQMEQKNLRWDPDEGVRNLSKLTEPHENALLATLILYPGLVEDAAQSEEPHQLAYYLRELANDFHTYYNAHQFLVDDEPLRDARICLIQATGQVLRNGLGLLGVSAPEAM
ncbi:MAG: arginine--tRNA ligase [Gammaproteobacteria bacterium]|nr:arginine--tRNA ligase [Gammaproteobacteria bacterium]MCI0591289.1 arginine--tRNA ligase [Gammaproteobacteria bacterium]